MQLFLKNYNAICFVLIVSTFTQLRNGEFGPLQGLEEFLQYRTQQNQFVCPTRVLNNQCVWKREIEQNKMKLLLKFEKENVALFKHQSLCFI